ncbi:MAG: hypothetical protein ACRER2_17345 [Methylococcales bacterium]
MDKLKALRTHVLDGSLCLAAQGFGTSTGLIWWMRFAYPPYAGFLCAQ